MSQLKWSQKLDQMQQYNTCNCIRSKNIARDPIFIRWDRWFTFFAFDCLYGHAFFDVFFSFIIAKFFPLFFVFIMSFWKNNKKEITNFHLPILIQHYNATCVDVHTTTTCMTIIICDSRIFFPLHYQLHTLYYIWYIKIQSIGIL